MQQLQSTTSPNHNNKGIGIDIASEDQLCRFFNGMGIGIGIDSEDLVCEIFFRLPLISLLRFKCVSKSWYSLITNLNCLRCHWNYNNSKNKKRHIDLLLWEASPKPIDVIDSALSIFRLNLHIPITYKDDLPYLHIVLNNSCNGLLLYHSFILNPQYSHHKTELMSSVFYVCNPLTRNYIRLKNIQLKNVNERDEYKNVLNTTKACIVLDPSVSLSYKVIRCCERITCDKYGSYRYDHILYVYSSETGLWRRLACLNGHCNFGFRTALLNGVFYWYSDIRDVCLCFDVKKENVWFLPLPMKPKKRRMCLYFGDCGGRLHLIEKYHDMNSTTYDMSYISFPCNFDIMEMEQLKENERQCFWKVKYHVNVDPGIDHLTRKLENPQSLVSIIHFYRTTSGMKKEVEDKLLMSIVDTKMVVSFNLTSNTFGDEVIEIPNIENGSKLRDVVPYIPTLFPVHQ